MFFEAHGSKQVLYKIIVTAKSKAEAIKKVRAGDVETVTEVYKSNGFALGGAGREDIKEIKVPRKGG